VMTAIALRNFIFDASNGGTSQPSGQIPPTFVRFCARS
jgi:hypothetical protein